MSEISRGILAELSKSWRGKNWTEKFGRAIDFYRGVDAKFPTVGVLCKLFRLSERAIEKCHEEIRSPVPPTCLRRLWCGAEWGMEAGDADPLVARWWGDTLGERSRCSFPQTHMYHTHMKLSNIQLKDIST